MNSVFEFTGELSTKVKKRICNIHKITSLIILTISTPIGLLIALPVIGLLMENVTKIALIVTALSYPVLMIILALIYPKLKPVSEPARSMDLALLVPVICPSCL